MTELEIRLFVYERAHRNIPLAIEYLSFLKESLDCDDLDIRMKTLEMHEGKPLEIAKEVYLFLKGFVQE